MAASSSPSSSPPPAYSLTASASASASVPVPGPGPDAAWSTPAGLSSPSPRANEGSPSSAPFSYDPGLHLYRDPRTSSTQSIAPSQSSANALKRTLLIIYIHGFLGNDQSFRSFPAHVHALLTTLLADTHVIHSKIYPRYKTYRVIDIARDNFSSWLAPHENDRTDVVLVGHSMGGLLAADIALLPNRSPYGEHPYKHRILGTVNLDCPFLGLHPGIIVSGISSIFKPSPQPGDAPAGEGSPDNPGWPGPSDSSLNLTASHGSHPGSPPAMASPASPSSTDPFFNPPFFNDAAFREQPLVHGLLSFAKKHRNENIMQAAAKRVVSYLEYGGCLADSGGLERRYLQLRALEDVDELMPYGPGKDPNGPKTQIRFVNYYTLCTGRPKQPKQDAKGSQDEGMSNADGHPNGGREAQGQVGNDGHESEQQATSEAQDGQSRENQNSENCGEGHGSPEPSTRPTEMKRQPAHPEAGQTASPPPKIRIERYATEIHQQGATPEPDGPATPDIDALSLHDVDPIPMEEPEGPLPVATDTGESGPGEPGPGEPETREFENSLPPIPDPPMKPEPLALDSITDKDARKQAEKEHKRRQKAYDQLVKDRAKAVKEREKMLEKRRKKAHKEAERLHKEDVKQHERQQKEALKQAQREEKEQQRLHKQHQAAAADARALAEERPRKLRQFCNLPSGADPTWVDVFMEGVDEVGAHCGLFAPGPHYEKLVGDVAGRILGWLEEDMTKRAIVDMEKAVD